jgi:hypothetical protein
MSVATGAAAQEIGFIQSHAQFLAAVDNPTSSPSYVLLTVVDGRNGEAKTGCTLAVFLLGAMHLERHLDYSDGSVREVRDLVVAQTDHRYVFSNAAALHNVGFESLGTRALDACRIIRSGHPAYQQDITHRTIDGQPV